MKDKIKLVLSVAFLLTLFMLLFWLIGDVMVMNSSSLDSDVLTTEIFLGGK